MATWVAAPIDGLETEVTDEVAGEGGMSRIDEVIAAWRAADRRLAGLEDSDPERNRVQAELVGLRALHHRLFDVKLFERPRGDEASARWAFAILAWGSAPIPARVLA
jgi:hypothetical protein